MDFKNMFKCADFTKDYDKKDIEANKVMSLFSYLGLLVLIPILACKDSKFAKFHANQGLKLTLANIAICVVASIIMGVLGFIAGFCSAFGGFLTVLGILAWIVIAIFGLLLSIINLGYLVLVVFGIIAAVQGNAKEIPVVKAIKFDIIK